MNNLIVFIGGHHNSTLEVAKSAQKNNFQTLWLGHKFNHSDNKSFSAEYQEVTLAKIPFLELKTGRFYKKINFFEVLKIIFGFFQAAYYLLKYRPALVFSSGGYMAVPVVVVAYLLRIPSLTHEQTVVSGWANKAIAPFVKKVLLTHAVSEENYPKQKSEVVGLPVRAELVDKNNSKIFHPKLLYVTCGKQGSHLVNDALFPLIPTLVKKFTIVHQVGSNVLTKDLDRARRIKERLGVNANRYQYAPYYFGKDSATYLRSADIVISRAGAHTIYELIVLNKKAVVIPISWVSHQEQLKNAELAKKEIECEILEEQTLNSEYLLNAITKMDKLPKKRVPTNLKNNVAEKIVSIIKSEIAKS